MSTNSISSVTPAYPPPAQNGAQQNFQALAQAVQAGNLSGAQQGLQTMQQGMKSHHGHRHHAAPEQGASSPATPASTDIATVSSVAGTLDISA